MWGASVPLMQGSTCRYALSLVGPKFRLPKAQRTAIIDALLKAGRDISAQLGA